MPNQHDEKLEFPGYGLRFANGYTARVHLAWRRDHERAAGPDNCT